MVAVVGGGGEGVLEERFLLRVLSDVVKAFIVDGFLWSNHGATIWLLQSLCVLCGVYVLLPLWFCCALVLWDFGFRGLIEGLRACNGALR